MVKQGMAKRGMAKLRCENLQKSFGATTVCEDINLSIEEGALTCLIGASGSGKSTLLRCLNLLEPIDDGAIWLDGADISVPGLDPEPIRRSIGMVFQNYNLFPHMTAAENVMLAPRRVGGKTKAQLRPEIEALFERFNLSDRIDAYPDQLSGGQQQRVAIIRALAMSPEILLLDEITAALDPHLVGEVLDVLHDLKRSGMTMVLATHEMRFARDAADKICFLHEGRILEEGAPEQIFEAPQQQETRAFLARVHM